MDNSKLIRSASVMERILKILQGFAMAGVIVAGIFVPLTAIFGEKIIASADVLSIGPMELRLRGDSAAYLDLPNIKLSIIAMLVCAILAAGAAWYCLRVLRQILEPMKEGAPFAAGISGRIRKLAWAVLIGGGVAEAARTAAAVFEVRAYQIERLLNRDLVASVSYSFTLELWFVAAALILFFLSYVFRCGETLQRESDETL